MLLVTGRFLRREYDRIGNRFLDSTIHGRYSST